MCAENQQNAQAAEPTKGEKMVAGLRALADWYETHPDAPTPFSTRIYVFPDDLESVRPFLDELYKSTSKEWVIVGKQFGPVELAFAFERVTKVPNSKVNDLAPRPKQGEI
jgi:hypothetical protein